MLGGVGGCVYWLCCSRVAIGVLYYSLWVNVGR